MLGRCLNKKNKQYKDYGFRGITVCPRWFKFDNFFDDMGPRPKNKSLDRIDNYGNYEPSNCRWADRITQNNNRRNIRYITINGHRMPISQAANIYGISRKAIGKRLMSGYSDEEAIQPLHPGRKK